MKIKRILIFSILILSLSTISFSSLKNKVKFAAGFWTGHFTIKGKYYPNNSSRSITGKGKINVYLPSKYTLSSKRIPLIIGLPGWRAKADEWRTKGKVERFAEKYNFAVALVEVWTTAYETSYYRETNPRYKWGNIPGTLWVGGVVLPFLRTHFNVDNTGRKTGIFGLSTGGRGAVYIPQVFPKYFRAAASLSGDFDRISILNWCKKRRKNIMRHDPPSVTIFGYPGNSRILKRWATVDNPSSRQNILKLKKNNISVLLIHGKRDQAVPYEQSRDFYLKLKKTGVDVKYVASSSDGHDWGLWASYLPLVFQFFSNKF